MGFKVGFIFAVCLVLLGGTAAQITSTFNAPNGFRVNEQDSFVGCVELSEDPGADVAVTLSLSSNTEAVEGVNFGNPDPATLSFSPTTTMICFNIPILQDNVVQNDQAFIVSFSSVDVTPPDPVSVIIVNTDSILVGFSESSFTVSEDMSVEVCADMLEGAVQSGIGLRAAVTLEPNTASAAADYVVSLDTILFTSENERSCTSIVIIDDDRVEGDESFTVRLVPQDGEERLRVRESNEIATITITDNDMATIGFSQTMYMVDEGDFNVQTQLEVCVDLLPASGSESVQREVGGRVASTPGTAASGQDFVSFNMSFSFAAGSTINTPYCFDVTIIGDNRLEMNETFEISLTAQSPDRTEPAANTATVTLIHDGDTNICPMLSNISNGDLVINGFLLGSTASYSCIANFEIRDGLATRMCQENGVWSGNEPRCAAICPSLDIENGAIVFSNQDMSEGNTATAMCSQGYEVVIGDRVRVCQSDNTWSGVDARCTFIDCGALTDIQNGMVTHTSTSFGSQAIYRCDEGFRLNGNQMRTCSQSGDWSGTEPECNGALKSVLPAGALSLLVIALLASLLGNQPF